MDTQEAPDDQYTADDGSFEWDFRRRRMEVWTWQLMAALVGEASVKRFDEQHAAGGMYDSILAVLDGATAGAVPVVSCNRPGRVHVVLDGADEDPVRDLLGDIDQGGDAAGAARWVAARADARPGSTDSPLAVSATMMAAAVAVGIGAGGEWHWRNGRMDYPGEQWGWRLFAAVPSARQTLAERPGIDEPSGCGRFWFLLNGYRAVLAVDTGDATLHVNNDSMPISSPTTEEVWRGAVEAAGALSAFPPAGVAKKTARVAFAAAAYRLAKQLIDNPAKFSGPTVSGRAAWFTDPAGSQALVVVIGPFEDLKVADEVFAYALAWQGDRDLLFVAPTAHLVATAARAAWIDTTVRLYSYGEDLLCRPMLVPARAEVTAAAGDRPLHGVGLYEITEPTASRIVPLVEWANSHGDLVSTPRSSYLSWQYGGRQVLRITNAAVRAGTNPQGAPAVMYLLNEPLDGATLAEIQAKVSAAIVEVAQTKGLYAEHWFQAKLARGSLATGLGLIDLAREYPAWRADGGPGFIDFLGVEGEGGLHVVETKVGSGDPGVLLQALDYATWVAAHADEIRTERGWGPGPSKVTIDLVLAPNGVQPAVGQYLLGQLEALSRDLDWRVSIADDPLADEPVLHGPAHHRLPTGVEAAVAVRGPRWPVVVVPPTNGTPLGTPQIFTDPYAALLPGAAWAYTALQQRNVVHKYFRSARSSQAFALNLFAPLEAAGLRQILHGLGHPVVEVEPVEFEFTDADNYLGEASHRTQIDVVLRGAGADGTRHMVLVEVKLTEADFGHCSAYQYATGETRAVCRQPGPFGGEPQRCPQLTGHTHGPRKYDRYLDTISVDAIGQTGAGGCALRLGLSQPMRNVALGRALVRHGHADNVTFAVCAPALHPSIWRRHAEATAILGPIAALPAEVVAAAHPDHGSALLLRYPKLHLSSEKLVMLSKDDGG